MIHTGRTSAQAITAASSVPVSGTRQPFPPGWLRSGFVTINRAPLRSTFTASSNLR